MTGWEVIAALWIIAGALLWLVWRSDGRGGGPGCGCGR
jgi:hypothetical protein